MPTYPYIACDAASGINFVRYWDETIGGKGANECVSMLHKVDTIAPTGAGRLLYWCDGTASQLWNKTMVGYCWPKWR